MLPSIKGGTTNEQSVNQSREKGGQIKTKMKSLLLAGICLSMGLFNPCSGEVVSEVIEYMGVSEIPLEMYTTININSADRPRKAVIWTTDEFG